MRLNRFLLAMLLALMLVCALILISCNEESATSTDTETDAEVTTYTVSFDANGGTAVNSISVSSGERATKPANPYKEGYTFICWLNGESEWSFDTAVSSDIQLVASWELKRYQITYELGEGTNNSQNKLEFTTQDLPLYLHEPSLDGYTFVGWESNGKRIHKITKIGTYELTAKFARTKSEVICEEYEDYAVLTGLATEENDIIIPEAYNGKPIKKIADGAFLGNDKIYSVALPNSLIEIGKEAFKGCKNLHKVTLGSSLEIIGDGAFFECSDVLELNIPQTLKYLGQKAFKGCTKLENINLPDGLKFLGEDFILDCPNLIYDYHNENKYTDNWLIEYTTRDVRLLDLKEGIVGIASYAVYNFSNLRTISLPDTVTFIGSHAFFFCYNVTKVELSNNLEYIGMYAFYRNIKLVSIVIPESVETIGTKAFDKCSKLIINCVTGAEKEGFESGWNGEREVIYSYTGEAE